MCGQALWRIGPFLLTKASCRHWSFQCISLICWAYFSDVMVSPGFRSCSGSAGQQTTKEWPWLFWYKFGFGKCFGASSQPSHWAGHHWLSYKVHFVLHITIWLRNGLLWRIREDDTSKWPCFGLLVTSWGTHLWSFFTFSICFKCQTTIEWSTLNSLTISCVVVRGSTLMIFSIGCHQLLMTGHCDLHLQGSCLLC